MISRTPAAEKSGITSESDSSQLPESRLWQPVTARWFYVVFGSALAYSIVRYHFSGEVAWTHFPLFILNKTTSLAAVIFVACSYLIGRIIPWHNGDPKIKLVVIKFCGLMGFSLAAIHAFFSVCMLTPAYFAKFFDDDGQLNLEGELGLAVGIVALWALARLRTEIPPVRGWLCRNGRGDRPAGGKCGHDDNEPLAVEAAQAHSTRG